MGFNDNVSVGKKIVEALKMQDGYEASQQSYDDNTEENTYDENLIIEKTPEESMFSEKVDYSMNDMYRNDDYSNKFSNLNLEQTFNQNLEKTMNSSNLNTSNANLDCPQSVDILKQLLSKLPSGVSKHTGAVIIKQTMEALGISMSSVLQDAIQYQRELQSATQCFQRDIVDCKKQISILENKTMQCQRQYSMLADIVNLFKQIGLH